MGLNIVLNLILGRYLAHGGIALSWSISLWWSAVILLVRLRRRMGPIGGRSLLVGAVQAAVASALMAAVVAVLRYGPLAAMLAAGAAPARQAAGLALLVAAGAAVYAGLLYLFRVEEWALVASLARRAWARRRGPGAEGQRHRAAGE